jgi:hypothetical protein
LTLVLKAANSIVTTYNEQDVLGKYMAERKSTQTPLPLYTMRSEFVWRSAADSVANSLTLAVTVSGVVKPSSFIRYAQRPATCGEAVVTPSQQLRL